MEPTMPLSRRRPRPLGQRIHYRRRDSHRLRRLKREEQVAERYCEALELTHAKQLAQRQHEWLNWAAEKFSSLP